MNYPVSSVPEPLPSVPEAPPSVAERPVVQMYTATICAYCIRAKMLLSKRHIPYEEINVGRDHDKRAWLVQATGRKTVPQIFIHGRPIGGFDELAALDRAGELMPMIEGPLDRR